MGFLIVELSGQHRDMGDHAFRSHRLAFSAYYRQHKKEILIFHVKAPLTLTKQ